MGVQLINPPQSKTSAYLEDDENQQRSNWSRRKTPFGEVDARSKADFLSQIFTKFDSQFNLITKWRNTFYDPVSYTHLTLPTN